MSPPYPFGSPSWPRQCPPMGPKSLDHQNQREHLQEGPESAQVLLNHKLWGGPYRNPYFSKSLRIPVILSRTRKPLHDTGRPAVKKASGDLANASHCRHLERHSTLAPPLPRGCACARGSCVSAAPSAGHAVKKPKVQPTPLGGGCIQGLQLRSPVPL